MGVCRVVHHYSDAMNFSDIVTALESEIASLQQTPSLLLVPSSALSDLVWEQFPQLVPRLWPLGTRPVSQFHSERFAAYPLSDLSLRPRQIWHEETNMASNPEADVN
jgi:hypothetical protein